MAKSLKKSSAVAPTPSNELFKMDSTGDSSVRNTLLGQVAISNNPAQARLRKGTSFNKVLKSNSILAMRSSEPAMTGRKIPDALTVVKKDREKAGKVDRATKERLKRIVGRDGQGSGLWGLKSTAPREELMTAAMKSAGEYDAWEVIVAPVVEGEDLSLKAVVKANTSRVIPKPPSTLREHPLLAAGAGPSAVPIPHPGTSYNPSHPHHQSLLDSALTHYTAVETREDRGQPIKDAMDSARLATKGLENWEIYQTEVGSGEDTEEDEEMNDRDPSAKKKLSKRKTKSQRNKKVLQAAEALALSLRKAAKARNASVVTAPAVNAELDESIVLSLAEKALAMKVRKARVAERGLTRLRSGPSKVPDAPITYQLGEELADNLRLLQPEGNLWREWVGSGMRRGIVPVERANISKKGGKRGGRGHDKGHMLKTVEKHAWKRFS